MSSAKKSSSSLILFLVLFLVIAGASWFYFTKQPAVNEDQSAATDMLEGDEAGEETAASVEDGHTHEDAQATTSTDIGKKGTIHKLTVQPLLGVRGVGDPNAPVKIQEFFSLTCGHCAAFHTGTYQELKTKYIDTGKVYFIHEEFPLNGPALYGSMIARCLPEERYDGFIDLLLRTMDKWAFGGDFKASLQQNAKLAGMSDEQFEACFNNQDLQKQIAQNIKEASDVWKISSTPSFVVNNGELVFSGEQPIESFDKAIAQITGEPVPESNVDKTMTPSEGAE